jgi:DNA polymerase
MRLPSGRRLAYYKPQLDVEGKVTYLGIDTYTRQWKRVSTYGGKLTENAVQAIARDLLVHAMFNLEEAGYKIVGHVHDEVIIEILETLAGGGDGDKTPYTGVMLKIYELMVDKPKWYDGPIDAREGYRAKRYRK